MKTSIYKLSVGGKESEVKLGLDLGQGESTEVRVGEFVVGDFTLGTFDSDHIKDMQKLADNSEGALVMGAKGSIWAPRGDKEALARCFIAYKGGEPAAYFNTGISMISTNFKDKDFNPCESGGYAGGMSTEEMGQFITAVTLYYDVVYEAKPDHLSKYVIYTTSDSDMYEALKASGWSSPMKGEFVFDALVSADPECGLQDRVARFKEHEGQFQERTTRDGNYVDKFLLVHEVGTNAYEEIVEVAGNSVEQHDGFAV